MDAVWQFLGGTPLAEWVRMSRWGYATLNGLHLLGIALLVGAIIPFNLRLFGIWPFLSIAALGSVLKPLAAAGLVSATVFGSLLFLSSPATYAAAPVFQAKIILIIVGTLSAVWFNWRIDMAQASPWLRQAVALISLFCWLSALMLGRFIAFTAD